MKKKLFFPCIILALTVQSFAAAPDVTFKRCSVCHGKDAAKLPPGGTKIISKLSADEIKSALIGYKEGSYGGKMKASMTSQVKTLSIEDIDAISKYIFENFHKE